MTTSLLSAFQSLGLATNASSSAATGAKNSVTDTTPSTQSLSQSDFLTLLTTQLTHQDPTNPTDSNAFVSQMAQFSTVSGIHDLLTSFQGLSGSLTSDQALQASNLVGQTVLYPGKQGYIDTNGGSISGTFTLPSATSQAVLTISDPITGKTVSQHSLGALPSGDSTFTWDGLDANKKPAPKGLYNVEVTAMIGGTNTAVATNIQSKVSSVTIGTGGSGLQVNLQGLASVPFSKVQTIY